MEMSTNGFDISRFEVPIKVQVLKVHIHCEGCKHKVKKLLRRIEGVYKVDIDTDQHKVIVTGNVPSAALIKKLEKSGKPAEVWSQNNSQIQPYADWIKYGKVQNQIQDPVKGFKGSKRRLMMSPPCGPELDDEWAYYGLMNQDMGRGQQPIMANPVIDNVDVGATNGYSMDGDGNMKPMMGFQGFTANDAGFPSFEHHHPPSYMMSNMQGGPQYNQQSPMMSMVGLQGFCANDAGLPSFEHHHPPSYMMNMQGGPQYNQQSMSTMMNMDMHGMQPVNNRMMNYYMHVHQPQKTNYASFPFIPNNDSYGDFNHVPYLANM